MMKASSIDKISDSSAAKLFENTLSIVFVHIMAAGFLTVNLWKDTQYQYLLHWGGLLGITLLVFLLTQSLFKRKIKENPDVATWEGIFSNVTICIGMAFSMAYCYVLFNSTMTLATTVSFIAIAHVACVSVPCFYSKRAMLSASLSIVIPILLMLAYLTNTANFFLFVGLLAFVAVFSVLGISFQGALLSNQAYKQKFLEAEERNIRFKSKLESLTIEDPLTRIYNRKFFDLMINNEARRAKRACSSLTIAIIEIDAFKEYYENYGADKTDKMLMKIAKKLSAAISRGGEFITRFDEHQFALILPNNNSQKAAPFITKMMDIVKNADIEHMYTNVDGHDSITISSGIAQVDHSRLIDIQEITEQALSAMKIASEKGGNRYQIFSRSIQTDSPVESILAETTSSTDSRAINDAQDSSAILEVNTDHSADNASKGNFQLEAVPKVASLVN